MSYNPFRSSKNQYKKDKYRSDLEENAKTSPTFENKNNNNKMQFKSGKELNNIQNIDDEFALADSYKEFRGDTFNNNEDSKSQSKSNRDTKGNKLNQWHGKKVTKSIQEGYDSPLSSSTPDPSNKFSEGIISDASSCIQDEEEGITRKPNVFGKFEKPTVSDKKTTNDSDILSIGNKHNNDHGEFIHSNERNGSIHINSSWEVVEGSSIIMELDSSHRQSSIHSKKKQSIK